MTSSSHSVAKLFPEGDGNLGVIEFADAPFVPRRLFWLYGVEPDAMRADHAHRTCHQLLVCLVGSVTAIVTDGSGQVSRHPLTAGETYHLVPLHWLQLVEFSGDAVLGVLASEPYRPGEYITTLDELRELTKN